MPLATLRIIDLARALAIEPDVLMLDEMTAALPANLTERVLEVIGRQRGGDRSVIFISHRMIEIAAVCDRATVLREGETVGVVDVTQGSEERIVELMLGDIVQSMPAASSAPPQERTGAEPRLVVRDLRRGPSCRTSRSSCTRARSWASSPSRARARTSCSTSWRARTVRAAASCCRRQAGLVPPSGRRHPRRPRLRRRRPRRGAADAALGAREHRAAVRDTPPPLGPDQPRRERQGVNGAIETLQIDARAEREVRRLSGGNQQKVTIARWVAGGVRTMLCFDPTRGIDIRTKQQIYVLLRDLAEAGAAILLYTSELKEIQLVCDRAIVIFGGRVVAEVDAADADEPTLLRAAYNLRSDAVMPEEVAAETSSPETRPTAPRRSDDGRRR